MSMDHSVAELPPQEEGFKTEGPEKAEADMEGKTDSVDRWLEHIKGMRTQAERSAALEEQMQSLERTLDRLKAVKVQWEAPQKTDERLKDVEATRRREERLRGIQKMGEEDQAETRDAA